MADETTVENILKAGDVSCDELFLTTQDNTQWDFKNFIVIDNSVKPTGIVYESNSKEECTDWIKKWKN